MCWLQRERGKWERSVVVRNEIVSYKVWGNEIIGEWEPSFIVYRGWIGITKCEFRAISVRVVSVL